MFQLTVQETVGMRSQIATASRRNVRFRPYAFTEHGVAMQSSVLNSDRAIQVNISIMRAFIRLTSTLTYWSQCGEEVVVAGQERVQLVAARQRCKSDAWIVTVLGIVHWSANKRQHYEDAE